MEMEYGGDDGDEAMYNSDDGDEADLQVNPAMEHRGGY